MIYKKNFDRVTMATRDRREAVKDMAPAASNVGQLAPWHSIVSEIIQ